MLGRGLEIEEDTIDQQCKLWCKYAEQYHNNEFAIEMQKIYIFIINLN